MVSSMEEFFRTVSVSQLFSLTPRCGFSPSIDENIFDYTEIDWESVEIRNDCCSIARSGCVQRGQPMPTQRTPTVTCEAKKFSDFHEDKIFLGTNQFSMTTSGIEHMDEIWSGRIFSTYVHQAFHPISSLALTSKLDEILFWSLKH